MSNLTILSSHQINIKKNINLHSNSNKFTLLTIKSSSSSKIFINTFKNYKSTISPSPFKKISFKLKLPTEWESTPKTGNRMFKLSEENNNLKKIIWKPKSLKKSQKILKTSENNKSKSTKETSKNGMTSEKLLSVQKYFHPMKQELQSKSIILIQENLQKGFIKAIELYEYFFDKKSVFINGF